MHEKKFELSGKLIVVEGIDGSGKSTQLRLVEKWLKFKLLPVFLTEWNSSETVKEITSKGKKKGTLTPTTFSLLHATDFADRYARDIVRGCSPKWVCKIYKFAVKPDIVFYFRIPIDIAIERILSGRPKLKYYEAGMDLNLSNDPYESYRIFQSRIVDEYESMVGSEGFTVIDGRADIEKQQQLVRQKITQILQPQPKTIRQHVIENITNVKNP